MSEMNPICFALKESAERLWVDAKAVEKSNPFYANELKSLAKSNAKEADEIANKGRITCKRFLNENC